MRKTKIYLLSLVMGLTFFTSAGAIASGFPLAILSSSSLGYVIVIGKFASGSGQFTQAEANNLSLSVAGAIPGLIQSLLGSSSVSAPTVLTPNQLAAAGLSDADDVINLVKANYKAWGYSFYAVVNISKYFEYATGYGQNLRLDVYIADIAALLGLGGDYLYAASIEVPYMYASLLR